jgi:hypothetical protein
VRKTRGVGCFRKRKKSKSRKIDEGAAVKEDEEELCLLTERVWVTKDFTWDCTWPRVVKVNAAVRDEYMSRDKKSAIAVENLIPYSVMMRDETICRLPSVFIIFRIKR